MAERLGLQEQAPVLRALIHNMYRCFVERDCQELTIKSLVLTEEQRLSSMEVSVEIDDSAIFRQAEFDSAVDYSQLTYQERLAKLQEASYVKMGGNIGVMANGTGLCLATNDLI